MGCQGCRLVFLSITKSGPLLKKISQALEKVLQGFVSITVGLLYSNMWVYQFRKGRILPNCKLSLVITSLWFVFWCIFYEKGSALQRGVRAFCWWNICWLFEIFQIYDPPTSSANENEIRKNIMMLFIKIFPKDPPIPWPTPPFSKKFLFISLPWLKIFWNPMIFQIKKYHALFEN